MTSPQMGAGSWFVCYSYRPGAGLEESVEVRVLLVACGGQQLSEKSKLLQPPNGLVSFK